MFRNFFSKEQYQEYISSIVLGINDGLIELTGALVGFSFAFQETKIVALTGFITGFAAAMSMAASAYMQAEHEDGKHSVKAGLYTGIAYLIVVLILVTPFAVFHSIYTALPNMLAGALLIITVTSYHSARLLNRKFFSQFLQMSLFSLGVAALSFLIGLLFRRTSGVNL